MKSVLWMDEIAAIGGGYGVPCGTNQIEWAHCRYCSAPIQTVKKFRFEARELSSGGA